MSSILNDNIQMMKMFMVFSLASIALSSVFSMAMPVNPERGCGYGCGCDEHFTDIDMNATNLVKKHDKISLESSNTMLGATVDKFVFVNLAGKTIFRIRIEADLYNIIEPDVFTVITYDNKGNASVLGKLDQDIDMKYKLFYESEDLALYDNIAKIVITQTIQGKTSDILSGKFFNACVTF